jgi:hypothetical protein
MLVEGISCHSLKFWLNIFDLNGIVSTLQRVETSRTTELLSISYREKPELEFLKSLWGLGTEEEEGYRTGPPG